MAPLSLWGLPTSATDDVLFGGRPPWPATQFQVDADLQRLRMRAGGADTDLNPLADRTQLVELTADDAARAEILRRYRLFSRQPDEMIILRALQRMNPRRGDLDPRLYQYGGAYIYAVGGAIAAGSITGLIRLTSDAGYYLEHPEAFARFYLAARAISLASGALALLAVFQLGRRTGGRRAGWVAALLTAASPVFITAVLEAKPHLPSSALILWAALAGLEYVRSGRGRDAARMGVLAGLAAGVVLTGVLAGLLWPALVVASLARKPRATAQRRAAAERVGDVRCVGRDLAVAALLAVGMYVAANPYVAWNLVANRAALDSNLANSWAMYQDQIARAGAGAVRVAVLLVEAAGWGLPVAGGAGLIWAWRRHGRPVALAALPGLGFLLMAVLLGAGKPAEYARFLILPALLLAVAAGAVLAAIMRRRLAVGVLATLIVVGLMSTPAYVGAFAQDAGGVNETRRQAGRWLAARADAADAIGVLQEPAPYAVPPIDFAHRTIWLLPTERPAGLEAAVLPPWLVFTADDEHTHADAWWQSEYELAACFPATGRPARIAWANKPVFVYRKRTQAMPPASGDTACWTRQLVPPADANWARAASRPR